MKKIGILTYFWADNPGTFLQAFATYKAFAAAFPESNVELIDYKHRYVFYKPGLNHLLNGKFIEGYKRHARFQKLIHEKLPLSHPRITSQDRQAAAAFIKKQNYDLIVVGSDTVLQLLPFHQRNNEVPIYWLPTDISCIKVVCAASSSALSLQDLSEPQKNECRTSMEHYNLIGVRDEATYSLIDSLNIRNKSCLEIIPDPTFTLDIDCSPVDTLFKRIGFDPNQRSILIDLPRKFSAARHIAGHFRSQGYRIISLVPADYADICFINISPFEWAGIYKYCRLVITQRFHGTIFSLKNLVPVLTIVWSDVLKNREGLSKHLSLLKSFGMEEISYVDGECSHDVGQICRNAEMVIAKFDKKLIQDKLEQRRNDYLAFIYKIVPLMS